MAENKQLSKEDMAKYDYVIMIDKSGSMETRDCPGNKTRWEYAQEQTLALAMKAEEFDDNGIDVVLFAGTAKTYKNVKSDKVKDIFAENSPGGSTETAAALEAVLADYLSRRAAGSAKPLIVVCATDGQPNDFTALKSVIVNHTQKMENDGETGITFIQIGKDASARAFLKQLDDELVTAGAKFDIVDCVNDAEMENLSITEILANAVAD